MLGDLTWSGVLVRYFLATGEGGREWLDGAFSLREREGEATVWPQV